METSNVFSKEQLLDFLPSLFSEYDPNFTEIFVSKEPLSSSKVSDHFGKAIFPNQEITGWLVFVDVCTIANWSHPCEYWLITNESTMLKSTDEKWMPSDSIDIDKLKGE